MTGPEPRPWDDRFAALAAEVVGPEVAAEEGPEVAAFALAVEAVDYYVRLLEGLAAEDPAPFFGGTTPIEAALLGLRENLDILRGDG